MADVVSEETKDASFDSMPGLSKWMRRQLKKLKLTQPTPVQYHCIPPALEGRDVIGTAKTGSGKTLAFVIPILQHLSVDPYGIYALVLTPTRELAIQISEQFKAIGAQMDLRVEVIIGGMHFYEQGVSLAKLPHVIVATPGRLADYLSVEHDFTLKKIRYLVIDEADRLMDGKYDDQLKVIWGELPPKRQTLLFSATITDRLEQMKQLAQSEVFFWESKASQATVEQLEEKYLLVNPVIRDATMVAALVQFRKANPKALCIVFTSTCKNTQVLSQMLKTLGIQCVCLHSLLNQMERIAALQRFKSCHVNILIATDVASRGLDIPEVELIINHCVPTAPKTYIHRVGRTARAGRCGKALTFIIPSEIRMLMAIEALTKRKMGDLKINKGDVKKILKKVNMARRMEELKLEVGNFDERKKVYKRKKLILQGIDPDEYEAEKAKINTAIQKRRKKQLQEMRQELYNDDVN